MVCEDRSSRQFTQNIGRDKKLTLSECKTACVAVWPFGASPPVGATMGGRPRGGGLGGRSPLSGELQRPRELRSRREGPRSRPDQ